jgi:hypothetical protein
MSSTIDKMHGMRISVRIVEKSNPQAMVFASGRHTAELPPIPTAVGRSPPMVDWVWTGMTVRRFWAIGYRDYGDPSSAESFVATGIESTLSSPTEVSG